MKKIITTVFCTAIALCSGLNVYAAESGLTRTTVRTNTTGPSWVS